MTITVVGLGKLGSPMAALFASAGHDVIGVDRDPQIVEAINRGRAPVAEPGLQDLLTEYSNRIEAVTPAGLADAAKISQYVFVIVPTPSRLDNSFSPQAILDSLPPIAAAIKDGAHPIVVVTSTVSPGTMDNVITPELEKLAGTCCGAGFDLLYNPEFIALGSVLRNMRRPDFTLIGGNIADARQQLQGFYADLHRALNTPIPPVASMSAVNAEITKLALNCYCTMKISFANSIAALCEQIPGGDAAAVCGAIGMDSRIGPKYLKPATKYGGECFPRDCRAMLAVARDIDYHAPLAWATDRINSEQSLRIVKWIKQRSPASVAVLGVAFKADTPITTESVGIDVLRALQRQGIELYYHDPQARTDLAQWCAAPADATGQADVVVIATPHREYDNLDSKAFRAGCRIIDCWGVTDPATFRGFDIVTPGRWRPQ